MILYVGDLVKVKVNGTEWIGKVEGFEVEARSVCRRVLVDFGENKATPVIPSDIVEVVESVGPRKVSVSDGSSFNLAGVRPPGRPEHWRATT